MLARLLVTSTLLISSPSLVSCQYRPKSSGPIRPAGFSENFLVRPGVIATATYGSSGRVCQLVISPQRLWNSTIGSVNVWRPPRRTRTTC